MIITLDNVNHSFTNFKLNDINLTIEQGEFIGLKGENGSGKSTLMKIIAGILKSDNIYIDGNKLNSDDFRFISYMDSSPFFYELLSVYEMIDFKRNIVYSDFDERIFEWSYLLGLEKYKNEIIRNLSLGNRQKLSLILTLIGSPKFILLDEPFNGMDSEAVNVVIKLLFELVLEKRTVVITTHNNFKIDKLYTREIILNEGKIIQNKILIS